MKPTVEELAVLAGRLDALIAQTDATFDAGVVVLGVRKVAQIAAAKDTLSMMRNDVGRLLTLRDEGCECDLTGRRDERCDGQWIRCNGRLKAR